MISGELKLRFKVRFVETARERLGRVETCLPSDDPYVWNQMASELHALSGEAAMLGLPSVSQLAREGEDQARLAASGGTIDEDSRLAQRERVESLREAVESI